MEQKKPNTITDIIKPELPNLMAILSLNSDKNNDTLQTIALQELNYLEQQAVNKPELLTCQPLSIILGVKNVLRKNLTLDPSAGLVYIKTRRAQVNGAWIDVLDLQETANGLLSYNRQLGRILDYTNPKIQKDEKGRVVGVSMRLLKPSPLGPRWEDYEYDESDFRRWATYSHKDRSRNKQDASLETLNYANQLYRSWMGGIDPEFARAKCIRHTLKKLGSNPNEGLQVLQPIANVSIINTDMAMAEAGEGDGEYTHAEEIKSTINEEKTNIPSNGTSTSKTDVFDPNDL